MRLSDHPFLSRYRGKPVILDSNLLILCWCAKFDPGLINSFKRLNSFQIQDIELLSETLKVFSEIRTTPHILTEVSNLTSQLPAWVKDGWYAFFAAQIGLISETYEASTEISSDPVAIRFGLTDAAILHLAGTHVVLTIDWPLANLLESRHLPVINFTHLREAQLFS